MDCSKLSNKKKVELLEATVLTGTPEDVSDIYSKIGEAELTARALGIACRFRGLDWVKALVKGGAVFTGIYFQGISGKYDCGRNGGTAFHDPDYSLMLLDNYDSANPYFGFDKQHIQYGTDNTVLIFNGKEYNIIPLQNRIKITEWMAKNWDGFNASRLLFNSILTESKEMADAMIEIGVKLDQNTVDTLVKGECRFDWEEWTSTLQRSTPEKLLRILPEFSKHIGENKLKFTQSMFKYIGSPFLDEKVFSYVFDNCNTTKLNMKEIIEDALYYDNVEVLKIASKYGAFDRPDRRDAYIEYANEEKKMNSLAWLLEYKNNTVDWEKENEARQKKIMKDLTVPRK